MASCGCAPPAPARCSACRSTREVVDPNDVAMLEDLVVAALHDMNAQLLEIQREAMGPLAGLGDLFGGG